MGAICSYCKQDMRAAEGCIEVAVVNERGTFAPIKYGEETRYGHGGDPERCHDCASRLGKFHHRGCDWEECPSCHEQFIGCDCGNTWD